MKISFFFAVMCCLYFGCASEKKHADKLDKAWLDAIIKQSDTTYTKPYFRTDFVTATYYVNHKDSSTCQVMKDSAGIIRQVIIETKNIRTFFGQYYNNGQLQAWLPLDEFGQYHGEAMLYFPNGSKKSEGAYAHGLKIGSWNNFDEKGSLLSKEEYDNNGGLIKTLIFK